MIVTKQVVSSAIKQLAYDLDRRVLTITFTSGNEYDYENFEQDTFERFYKAKSVGRFYNEQIKGLYI